jgi:hypothetical protein
MVDTLSTNAQKNVGLDANTLTKVIGGQEQQNKVMQQRFEPPKTIGFFPGDPNGPVFGPPDMRPPIGGFTPSQNFRPVLSNIPKEDPRNMALKGLSIKDNAFSIPGITRKRKKKVIKQKIKRKKCSCKKK